MVNTNSQWFGSVWNRLQCTKTLDAIFHDSTAVFFRKRLATERTFEGLICLSGSLLEQHDTLVDMSKTTLVEANPQMDTLNLGFTTKHHWKLTEKHAAGFQLPKVNSISIPFLLKLIFLIHFPVFLFPREHWLCQHKVSKWNIPAAKWDDEWVQLESAGERTVILPKIAA